jgi:hypothetical protein
LPELLYPESSSNGHKTTKRTKDTNKNCQYVLPFLSDLRVLRGVVTYVQINWIFPDYRVFDNDFIFDDLLDEALRIQAVFINFLSRERF